jgi:hypothetical protein
LLQHRNKYKCAKCGRLFSQKFIEDKEFRDWNQRQRESDKEALKPKKRVKLSEEERRERIKVCQSRWVERNRKRRNTQVRKAWAENPKKHRKYKILQRKRNPEGFKLMDRILYLRKEQKKLAVQLLCRDDDSESLNNLQTL